MPSRRRSLRAFWNKAAGARPGTRTRPVRQRRQRVRALRGERSGLRPERAAGHLGPVPQLWTRQSRATSPRLS